MLFLLFQLDRDSYAIEAAQIEAVLPMLEAKQLPEAPLSIAGLIQYRGQAVPVVDLAQLALKRPSRALVSTRIVLVRHQSGRLLGLLLERATNTFSAELDAFQDSGIDNAHAPYLGKVAASPRGLTQWVKIDQLLTPEVASLLFPAGAVS